MERKSEINWSIKEEENQVNLIKDMMQTVKV